MICQNKRGKSFVGAVMLLKGWLSVFKMQTIMNNFKRATSFQGEQKPPSLNHLWNCAFLGFRFAVGKMITYL